MSDYRILEFHPSDPSRVTLRCVDKDEYMAVWVENNRHIIDNLVKPDFMVDPDVLAGAIKAMEEIQARDSREPVTQSQRAHERSKADRRRKSRKGKYKWGGSADD